MTASPKDLYLAAREIKRRCLEGKATNLDSNGGAPKGTLSKNNHWHWSIKVLSYLDDMPSIYVLSMNAIYWENEPNPLDRVIYFADEGLDKWYSSLPAALISQGDRVVAQVI